ncbi:MULTISPECIES: hypothetical protein [unclassified Acinetobacter]|uniref:hypothetical protein n=1 Tax=Acinetobacter TaxID=469 RepID=UPI0015D33029|nr:MULTISPECIES: hypothetical protein [unclassified Acinetobacter]MDC4505792.1 hypothetical protein [Acinetobacter baumannii]
MGNKVKTYAVRLPPEIAEFYDQLAESEGIRTSKLFSKILSNHFQSNAVTQQANRIENLVDRLEQRLDDFELKNSLSERYFEDFSTSYMMLLWLLMKGNASKDEIRSMQRKGEAYAETHFFKQD